jgi:pimeloyl-ACP methyl ester carboxylesterase
MARTPVIFVPGIVGSFNLPVLLDWHAPTTSGWDFPPFVDYGKQFVATFEKAGYTRNTDLFVAFYDWRKAVQDSAFTYLQPWIALAKKRAKSAKVILVSHSMGGLVSRSYIQDSRYAGDVERLITLGTPHRGSPDAYYTWGSGDTRSDPTTAAVFNVYLWYLRHVHPFQTALSPLRTMRTQVLAMRDLLPIDNYLLNQGGPPLPKPEDAMAERNVWGDILNLPAGIETLVRNVPVTTLSGAGFSTIQQIVVAGPAIPPGEPPLYPDGVPVSDIADNNGDGTVPLASAQLHHPQVKNLPSLNVRHSSLPDHPAVLTALLGELGVASPVLGGAPEAAPADEPKLVIMTASPVKMRVQTPAGPPMQQPGVLGAAAAGEGPPRRSRRIRARDHGHPGKHLNIVVVPSPAAGSYKVQLDGTATGTFALGALLIGADGNVQVLGGSAEEQAAPQAAATAITTVSGQVASGTELHYEVICSGTDIAPTVQLDAMATAYSALAKLRAGVQTAGAGVLGGSATSDDLRNSAAAALGGNAGASDQVAAMLSGSEGAPMSSLLAAVAQQVVGAQDSALAAAIMAQLRALG